MRIAIAAAHLLEDIGLPLLVGRCRIGLCDIEADVARAERLEHHRGKAGEPQTAFDETHRQSEPAGDAFDVRPLFDQLPEGEALVGRVHRQALEVLREAGLARAGRIAVEDEAGHVATRGNGAVGCKALQRPQAPAAGLDGEASPGFAEAGHHEILKESTRRNVRLQLEVGRFAGHPPHVARRGNELVERDGPDHDSLRMRAGADHPHLSLTGLPPLSPP